MTYWFSSVPSPSRPSAPHPQVRTSPSLPTTPTCLLPQEIAITSKLQATKYTVYTFIDYLPFQNYTFSFSENLKISPINWENFYHGRAIRRNILLLNTCIHTRELEITTKKWSHANKLRKYLSLKLYSKYLKFNYKTHYLDDLQISIIMFIQKHQRSLFKHIIIILANYQNYFNSYLKFWLRIFSV